MLQFSFLFLYPIGFSSSKSEVGPQIQLELVSFFFILFYVSSRYRCPKPCQFFWKFWGRKRGSYIFMVTSYFPLLYRDPLKQNKQVITKLFMCLEDVTEYLPFNLRNPVPGGQKGPGSPSLEIFRNSFIFCGPQFTPSPWFSAPFLFPQEQGKFPCFLHRVLYPQPWLPVTLQVLWVLVIN